MNLKHLTSLCKIWRLQKPDLQITPEVKLTKFSCTKFVAVLYHLEFGVVLNFLSSSDFDLFKFKCKFLKYDLER